MPAAFCRSIAPFSAVDGRLMSEPGRLSHLLQVPNIRFIILQRQNQFECLRSLIQAQETDSWQQWQGSKPDLPPSVTLSPPMAMRFFERAEQFYGRLIQLIPPGMRVWLDYEQLRGQTDMVMAHLWKFLEVPPYTALPELAKQEERPLKETVENYAELQLCFGNTDYGIFLP